MAMLEFADEDYRLDFEVGAVGTGIGGGFNNTRELKAMKYNEAIVIDKESWTIAVEEEHQIMVDNEVWRPVKLEDMQPGAKVLTSTWACKLKSNGTKQARINCRGYEQVNGVHYNSTTIHAPVTNENKAFLKDNLDQQTECMHMKVPEGFKKYYASGVALLLLKAIYGTKQAAMVFWRELLKCMEDLKYKHNGTDLCMYFKWNLIGLVIWLSWIDDCMVWGPEGIVKAESEVFNEEFYCDDGGKVTEYVGCNVERED
eukprot:1619762-Ditylum_brightwellii.AAC.1